MERMEMESRNQYLEVLRERYLRAKAKKEKSEILDEYCHNTGQTRKYVIRKIQPGIVNRQQQWDTIRAEVNGHLRLAPAPPGKVK